jgi:hypothetical protein
MIRTCKKWWLLRNLSNDCLGHITIQNTEEIKKGMWLGVDRTAYLDTLSKLPSNKKLNSEKLNIKLQEYNSIIESLIKDGYILLSPTDKLSGRCLSVSYLGDDMLSYTGLINLLWQKCLGVWGLIAWIITIILSIFLTTKFH